MAFYSSQKKYQYLIKRKVVYYILLSLFITSCTVQNEPSFDDLFELKEADKIINSNSAYIAVIGDIQAYTIAKEPCNYLIETCDWLRSQQFYFDCFACVLQNGDLTEYNIATQWNYADVALSHLGDNILLVSSTGNHDYNWGVNAEINNRGSSLFNSMKCLSTLRNREPLQFENGKYDNIIVPIKLQDEPLNIISLEFGPRKEVIQWADSIVRANPKKKYILMTHEWMTRSGERIITGSYADMQMPSISHSNPQEIWEKMVYPNDNILCVLCGHNGFCKYLFSTNQAGRDVCQILFNLQYQDNGGDGMVQLWEFPDSESVINISVYNTITRKFHTDPDTRVTVQL